jgi:hypothetical protein
MRKDHYPTNSILNGSHDSVRDFERKDALGSDINYAVLILKCSIDAQKAAAGDNHAVAFKDVWGEDDVGDAGFLFEREKKTNSLALPGLWPRAFMA